MDFKRVYEELTVLLPFNINICVQRAQSELIEIISFFFEGFNSQYESIKSQILYDPGVTTLREAYTRVLRTIPSSQASSARQPSPHVSQKNADSSRPRGNYRGSSGTQNHGNQGL